MGRIASMRTTKSKKDKYNGGHKHKERMHSTKEEDAEVNQELEDELDRIRNLPTEEFSKMFEKMLVSGWLFLLCLRDPGTWSRRKQCLVKSAPKSVKYRCAKSTHDLQPDRSQFDFYLWLAYLSADSRGNFGWGSSEILKIESIGATVVAFTPLVRQNCLQIPLFRLLFQSISPCIFRCSLEFSLSIQLSSE